MRLTRIALALSLVAAAVFVGACSNDSPVAPATPGHNLVDPQWDKVVDPVSVVSATLHVRNASATNSPATVHRVTANWAELAVTWANFAGAYDATVDGNYGNTGGWQDIDVTGLVTQWATGAQPNYGFLLDQDEATLSMSWSRNYSDPTWRPWLEVCYQTAANGVQCDSLQATADAYIWALNPTTNYGASTVLYTGFLSGAEKQSLVRFDVQPVVPDEPDDSCTLTLGYWMTHSSYGPAPYDETWAQIGEDTAFFLSGKTWYQAINTAPGGNAYYILARQYIAARLNQLAGATSTPEVDAALAWATNLFNTYTPAQVAAFTQAQRSQVIARATTLGNYNTGLIGPGHCPE